MADPTPSLDALAMRATYRGSGEHKRLPNPLCEPSLRRDASCCDDVDPTLSQDLKRLTEVLREAIRRGQVDRRRLGDFPRYAWGWVRLSDGRCELFEARLTNELQGHYKAYFIDFPGDLSGKKSWVAPMLAPDGAWSGVLA